jgi:hypothetical protein
MPSPTPPLTPAPVLAGEIAQDVKMRVDGFVRDHFHLTATLKLHRSALGWDLLRAPINVMLAPIFLLTALLGLVTRLIGWHRIDAWLSARRVLVKTSVARALEGEIARDLLQGAALTAHSRALIADYTGTRSAVAEITTSLLVLLSGWLLFGTTTLGIASLAPAVSGFVGHVAAVADFPLGSGLGKLWYGVFPVSLPIWFVLAIGIALAMVASVVTTFAGVIADPIQAVLGIHQRRLIKLVGAIAETEGNAPSIAPEHILARFADITDAGLSLLRFLRS